jgi:hypothetical protein
LHVLHVVLHQEDGGAEALGHLGDALCQLTRLGGREPGGGLVEEGDGGRAASTPATSTSLRVPTSSPPIVSSARAPPTKARTSASSPLARDLPAASSR